MANEIEVSELTREIAAAYKVAPDELVKTVKAICFPGGAASDAQLVVFLNAARKLDLDPLNKEIYAFVSSGKLQVIVGFDGWIKLATRNPQFAGFEFTDVQGPNGDLVAVRCKMFRKDWRVPGEATEYLAECKGTTDPWTKWPHRMLRNKAYIQCARMTFGFAGAIDPDEAERIETPERWQSNRTVEVTAERVDETTGEVLDVPNAELRAMADAEVKPNEQPPEQTAPSSVVVPPAAEPEEPKRGRPKSLKKHLLELAKALPPARLTVMLGEEGLTKIEDATDEQAQRMIAKIERRAK